MADRRAPRRHGDAGTARRSGAAVGALMLVLGGCGEPATDSEAVAAARPIGPAEPVGSAEHGAPAAPVAWTPPDSERRTEIIAVARQVGDHDLAEFMARLGLDGVDGVETPRDRADALALVAEILLEAGHDDEVGIVLDQLDALAMETVPSISDETRARIVDLRRRHAADAPSPEARIEALHAALAQQDAADDALGAARSRVELGWLLAAAGRPADATRLFERAEADVRSALDATPLRIVRVPALLGLARMRIDAGDRREARRLYEEAYSMRFDAAPESAWVLAEAELSYAEFLVVDGKAREGRDLAQCAVARLQATFGDDAERTRAAIIRAAAVDWLMEPEELGHDHDHP